MILSTKRLRQWWGGMSVKQRAGVTVGTWAGLFFLALGVSYRLATGMGNGGLVEEPVPTPGDPVVEVTPAELPQERTDRNILLLGYGGPGHEGGDLADVIQVVHIDKADKTLAFISIPRDLWYENSKINALYVKQGAEKAKGTIGTLIGMPIDYYAAVSFDGFAGAIDRLGGVEVHVPKTFDDYFYPVKGLEQEPCGKSPEEIAHLTNTLSGFILEKQFTCRYEHLHFDAGKTEMDGATALKFVRSRHSEQHGGDFARAERQHALMQGMKAKLLSWRSIDDVIPFFIKVQEAITTDVDASIIKALGMELTDLSSYSQKSITLSTANVFVEGKGPGGAYILLPKAGEGNFSGMREYIQTELSTSL
jgi:polyisoprenyl-teichoic acid--peptidoglycan teichoic acid transferase